MPGKFLKCGICSPDVLSDKLEQTYRHPVPHHTYLNIQHLFASPTPYSADIIFTLPLTRVFIFCTLEEHCGSILSNIVPVFTRWSPCLILKTDHVPEPTL